MTNKSNLRKLGNTGQGKTYVKFLLFARVLLFPTGSAILCVGFDLNFPPAPCLFDKIDDDHYCVQAFPPSRIVSLIYSINASICINGLHRMCCLVQYLVTVLFMMMKAIR